MPGTPVPVPLDFNALVTNLSVLVIAVAAVIGGAYKAWSDIRKKLAAEPADGVTGTEHFKILKATITETSSMLALTEANRTLADAMRNLCNRLDDLVEAERDGRSSMRSMHEEMHRLRVAVTDLHELLRTFRK